MSNPLMELSPEVTQRVRSLFTTVPFNLHLGAKITALGEGYCELRAAFRPELAQQDGYFHGGVIATLVDSCAGHAALTLMDADQGALTVEFKLNFLAPAKSEWLVVRSRVVKPGRTLTVAQSDAFTLLDGKETHCATALVTYMGISPRG